MNINIIHPHDNWILQKAADILLKNIPGAKDFNSMDGNIFKENGPLDIENTLNYFICYSTAYKRRTKGIDVILVTHPELGRLEKRAKLADFCICMSKQYHEYVKTLGAKSFLIYFGVDDCYKPRLNLFFPAAVMRHHKRKNANIAKLVKEIPFVNFITSEGDMSQEERRFYEESR